MLRRVFLPKRDEITGDWRYDIMAYLLKARTEEAEK
jgi:hypothetical protein